jgi:hypothetical protein
MAAMDAARLKRDPNQIDSLGGTLKIPGHTVFANPFPKWAIDDMSKLGYKFDDLNYYYYKQFPSREDADIAYAQLQEWRAAVEEREQAEFIVVRMMCDHADLDGLESF